MHTIADMLSGNRAAHYALIVVTSAVVNGVRHWTYTVHDGPEQTDRVVYTVTLDDDHEALRYARRWCEIQGLIESLVFTESAFVETRGKKVA